MGDIVFTTLTMKEALALKEFLQGIQAIDDSQHVRDLLGDIDTLLALEQKRRETNPALDETPLFSSYSAGADGDPAKLWNQIFDLGEALSKLASSSPLLEDARARQ